MSTTVTYKGSTLTTVDNQTRTLETAGMYLEDDITLVDVSQSAPNLQAKTNIAPTTSSQTITADTGYDGLSSVQINAMPAITLPTSASSSSSGTQKATISPSTSVQYLNIPTGYNSTAQYYQFGAMSTMTLPSSFSSSYSGTYYAALTVNGSTTRYLNIPKGYNSLARYYAITASAGTAGTPGISTSYSSDSVTITPEVYNTGGFITGGWVRGPATTISVTDIVSSYNGEVE